MKLNSPVRIQPRSRLVTASLVLGLLAAVQSASAAVQYWDPGFTPTANSGQGSGATGTGTDTWAAATANWSDGSVDAVLTTTNIAAFAGASGGAVTLTTSVTSAGVLFNTNGYTIGDGTNTGQLFIATQTNDTSGIVVGAGVTGTVINLGSIWLGSLNSSTSILLTNTDLADFKNTTLYLSGVRTTKVSNSTTSGTTTLQNFAVTDKPSSTAAWPAATVSLNQGNLTINHLAGASNTTGTLSTFGGYTGSATSLKTTFSGTSSGTLTINGDNTLYNNAGTGGSLIFLFDMTNGTLALGHDNALGARNASNALTGTSLQMNAGTVSASGGARTIENAVNITGNAAIGGSNNFTLSGNVTVSSGKTLTISNTAVTTLGGTNTNSGTIAVNSGGILLVNGTTTGGAYTIASGATFGGTGTIDLSAANGSVTLGNGSFLQATSADTLTFALGTGALNVSGALANASPSMVFTLGAPGSVVVSATSTNIGTGLLEFADFNFTAGSGFGTGIYTLFTSFVGTMGVNLTGTVGGLDATISQSGNDIILTTVSAVPEPSTYAAMAGVGVLGVALLRRRRRN